MSCTVRVSRPKADEALVVGEEIAIEWSSEGAASQRVEYSLDGGLTYTAIASDLAGSAQRCTWLVPDDVLSASAEKVEARFRVVAWDADDETTLALSDRVTISQVPKAPTEPVIEPAIAKGAIAPPAEVPSVSEAVPPVPEAVPSVSEAVPYVSEAVPYVPEAVPPSSAKPAPIAAPKPSITSVSPAQASILGGVRVAIAGAHFVDGAKVSFGDTVVPATLDGDALIVLAPPSIRAGKVDVTVTTDAGSDVREGAFEYVALRPPTIVSVSPTRGPIAGGTPITVVGRDLVEGLTCELDGVQVEVSAVTASGLAFVAPPHPGAGAVDLRVVHPDGQSAVLHGAFTYERGGGPKITRVVPTHGPAAGGTRVSIVSAGGEAWVDGCRVDLGGVAVEAKLENGDLVFVTPRRATGGAVYVRVERPDGQFDVAHDAFTYDDALPSPTISSLTPAKVRAGMNHQVTIAGAHFQEGCIVAFGPHQVAAKVQSPTTIVVVPPPHAPAIVDVCVINPDGGVDQKPQAFEYVVPPRAPAISAVRPPKGPVLGGTAVTIYGGNFDKGARVELSGLEVRSTVNDAHVIEFVTSPKPQPCFVDVRVINPDGEWGELEAAFQFEPLVAPKLVSLEPNAGPASGGVEVIVHGEGFVAHPKTQVLFGDRPAKVGATSAESIAVVAPAGPAGLVDVTVIGPDGQSATSKTAFRYDAAKGPELTSVNPKNGPVTGGTKLTLLGQNLVAGCRTFLGDKPVTSARIVDPGTFTTLEVVTPVGAAPGLIDVHVKNPDGQTATMKAVFRYDAVPNPETTSLMPKYGSASGGERITILGKHFVAGTTVTMGGVACKTVKVVDPTTIEAVAPPQTSPGMVDVVVKIPTGASATMKLAFQYTR